MFFIITVSLSPSVGLAGDVSTCVDSRSIRAIIALTDVVALCYGLLPAVVAILRSPTPFVISKKAGPDRCMLETRQLRRPPLKASQGGAGIAARQSRRLSFCLLTRQRRVSGAVPSTKAAAFAQCASYRPTTSSCYCKLEMPAVDCKPV
jgi:hypothetical protein